MNEGIIDRVPVLLFLVDSKFPEFFRSVPLPAGACISGCLVGIDLREFVRLSGTLMLLLVE